MPNDSKARSHITSYDSGYKHSLEHFIDEVRGLPMSKTRPKILVVDNEAAITSTLAAILRMHGYDTATASSGEEAVQVARSFRPDCIVSELTMRTMNGIEAAIELSRALPWCKVLLVSGNAGYGDLLEKARAQGFDFELLLKPVPPAELLERISQILPSSPDQNRNFAA